MPRLPNSWRDYQIRPGRPFPSAMNDTEPLPGTTRFQHNCLEQGPIEDRLMLATVIVTAVRHLADVEAVPEQIGQLVPSVHAWRASQLENGAGLLPGRALP
jgi:hypothetical protein